jgi:phosphoglycolate phosphatase-like HAD superfamily hydrolase
LEIFFGRQTQDAAVDYAGRTDLFILTETLRRIGVPPPHAGETLRAIFGHYLTCLDEELAVLDGGTVCPGVVQLLDVLSQRSDVALGLLTGNIEGGAKAKLRRFGLDRYFPFGAFGGATLDRNALVEIALDEARRRGLAPDDRRSVWLVGDTPNDIAAAKAAEVRIAAVSTGPYSLEDLAPLGPDLLLQDLTDPRALATLGQAPLSRSKGDDS